MEVPNDERTYLLEPLHKAAIAQLPRVRASQYNIYFKLDNDPYILQLACVLLFNNVTTLIADMQHAQRRLKTR